MDKFLKGLTDINSTVNEFVWIKIGIILLLGAGIVMTVSGRFFQILHIKHWFAKTIGSIFKKKKNEDGENSKKTVSQFQALCTALGATIGTGNIVGVAAAIVIGGPGAVFWMWIAAFFGMMTKFSEIVLGIYFRRKNEKGEWSGGAMYYLKDGLGKKKGLKTIGSVLAFLFAAFTIIASFGIGNMGQVNKITLSMESAFFPGADLGEFLGFPVVYLIIGGVLMVLCALIILGSIKRIAVFAETVVPFMAIAYLIGCIVLFCCNIEKAGAVFSSIFRFAFANDAIAGGITGSVLAHIITQGCKRGMFSNEAGLGSSVMVHSNARVKEPVKQGMWGIFEVFADTFVVCTATAFVILSSGLINLETGKALEGVQDADLVQRAFGAQFGAFGEGFVAIAILLFAFTTIVGWSQYGAKAVEYVFGVRATWVYKILFVLVIVTGSVMTSSLAWDISDTFNGLMMIPNLIGVVALCPLVAKLTKNYIDRRLKGKKDVVPMLSYDSAIQAEMAKDLDEE